MQGVSASGAFVLLTSTVLIIIFHENCSSSFFRRHFDSFFEPSAFKPLYPALYWFGCSVLIFGIIPLCLGRVVLKRPWMTWGIGIGDWRFGLPVTLSLFFAFLPVLVIVSYQPVFQNKYPIYDAALESVWHLVIYEAGYAAYFVGWEFIFRGFMLFGLRPAIGNYAVFVQMIPFAILHFGKPQLETMAAVFAGVILGLLALRTRSFWYGTFLHIGVAVTNDMLAVYQKNLWP